jgi:hypothetical protein
LPESREALAGTLDRGKAALKQLDRKLNMRRRVHTLRPNPELNGRRTWPLLDSFGRQIALIERHANHWELRDPAGERTLFTDRTRNREQIEVQGRGCMISDELEAMHALVAFRALDRSGLPPGASIVPFQLRAFIHRSALPAKNREGKRIRAAIDNYTTGSGGSQLGAAVPQSLADPGFASRERFLGEDGKKRSYATYNAKSPFGGAMYFCVNTTGVHGGGIVRGVARAGDPFEQLDRFGYADPNLVDGDPLTRWIYGRLVGTRMFGWIPVRDR